MPTNEKISEVKPADGDTSSKDLKRLETHMMFFTLGKNMYTVQTEGEDANKLYYIENVRTSKRTQIGFTANDNGILNCNEGYTKVLNALEKQTEDDEIPITEKQKEIFKSMLHVKDNTAEGEITSQGFQSFAVLKEVYSTVSGLPLAGAEMLAPLAALLTIKAPSAAMFFNLDEGSIELSQSFVITEKETGVSRAGLKVKSELEGKVASLTNEEIIARVKKVTGDDRGGAQVDVHFGSKGKTQEDVKADNKEIIQTILRVLVSANPPLEARDEPDYSYFKLLQSIARQTEEEMGKGDLVFADANELANHFVNKMNEMQEPFKKNVALKQAFKKKVKLGSGRVIEVNSSGTRSALMAHAPTAFKGSELESEDLARCASNSGQSFRIVGKNNTYLLKRAMFSGSFFLQYQEVKGNESDVTEAKTIDPKGGISFKSIINALPEEELEANQKDALISVLQGLQLQALSRSVEISEVIGGIEKRGADNQVTASLASSTQYVLDLRNNNDPTLVVVDTTGYNPVGKEVDMTLTSDKDASNIIGAALGKKSEGVRSVSKFHLCTDDMEPTIKVRNNHLFSKIKIGIESLAAVLGIGTGLTGVIVGIAILATLSGPPGMLAVLGVFALVGGVAVLAAGIYAATNAVQDSAALRKAQIGEEAFNKTLLGRFLIKLDNLFIGSKSVAVSASHNDAVVKVKGTGMKNVSSADLRGGGSGGPSLDAIAEVPGGPKVEKGNELPKLDRG